MKLNTRISIVLLPPVINQWKWLSYQDIESVDDYNTALMKITYGLELCGEVVTDDDLLYKTYSTFNPKDLVSTHKAKKFTTYNDLLSYLLANEQRKQKIQDIK